MIDEECELAQPTTIISAPPSSLADYPATAIWLERFQILLDQEEELGVDEDGQVLIGAVNELRNPAAPAMVGDTAHLSKIGAMIGSGRIWVGSRLPPKREEVESQITDLFLEDAGAPGRILLTIDEPRVGGLVLPWSWTGAVFLGDVSWSDEFAFSERLWSWIRFDLEVDLLVLRTDTIMSQVVVGLSAEVYRTDGVSALDEDPATQAADPNTEYQKLNVDGTVSPYP